MEFNRSLAVMIGINHYGSGIPSLRSAVNDATALAQLLQDKHQYEILLRLDQDATLVGLKELFEERLPQMVTEGDRLLLYFAGHGIALNGEEGPEGYLIPQDARLGAVASYLPMLQLNQALANLSCRHFLAILDCCFAGAFRWSSGRDVSTMPEVIHRERYDRFIQDPAWQVITSAAYDQKALDILTLRDRPDQPNSHSPFATALMAALLGGADSSPPAKNGKPAGDGVITATELYLYLRDEVEQATEHFTNRQTPGLWYLKRHDKGEYIFLTPGHALNLPPAEPLNVSSNPYRGLEVFDEAHQALFFGRTALTRSLYEFVVQRPLTVVLGASGSGKSSLVKAGLIPYLKTLNQEQSQSQWRSLIFRPGESPLMALRTVLKELGAPFIENLANLSEWNEKAFGDVVVNWSKQNSETTVLLVVDQVEELITLTRNEVQRQQVLHLLALLCSCSKQIHLVLTLRSDFEPQFRTTALQPYWQNARFIVPAMTREELRAAIEEPASLRVMHFDPHTLVDQLIDEVVQMPGALPLLSFALSELYLKYLQRQEQARDRGFPLDRAMTQADYDELGGVTRSLTQRADQEYETLVQRDSAYKQTIRHVLLRMVTTRGGEPTRRRVLLAELDYPEPEHQRCEAVIQRFSAARLIVGGQDAEGNAYVEPAHDALVQGWEKLQQWRIQNQETLTLQRLLTPAVQEWQQRYRAPGLLWNANPRLDLLRQMFTSSDNWLNKLEIAFIQASLQQRRNLRLIRGGAIATFLIGLSVAGAITFLQRTETLRVDIDNDNARSTANLRNDDHLSALVASVQAAQQLDQLNNGLGGLVQHLLHSSIWTTTTFRTTATLHQTLAQIREQNRLDGHSDRVNDVVFSSTCPDDEGLLASASHDQTIRLWSASGAPMPTLLRHQDSVTSVSISPDCQQIASGSLDGIVKLWRRDGTLLYELPSTMPVTDVRFSPDGQQLATVHTNISTGSGEVNFRRLDGTVISTLTAETHENSHVSFSPDNRAIALAGRTAITVWTMANQSNQTFAAHTDLITAVQFSPDGSLLASASNDGTIKLWQQDGTVLDSQTAHDGRPVHGLSFSPSGQTLASVGEDRTVMLWSLERQTGASGVSLRPVTTLKGHRAPVTSVSFRADGEAIATASQDTTVRIWNLNNTSRTPVLQVWNSNGNGQRAQSSPDGQQLAVLREDGKIDLWQLVTGDRKTLERPGEMIAGIGFSLDGRAIAAIAQGRTTVTLWNRNGELLPTSCNSTSAAQIGELTALSVSPNGRVVAIANGSNSTITLCHLDQIASTTLGDKQDGHQGYVTALRFSPDGTILASTSDDNTVKLWSLDGNLLKTLEGYSNGNQTLQFSPDSTTMAFLASIAQENTLKLWQIDRQKELVLESHTQPITSIRFSPNGALIATASRDRTIQLWTTTGRKEALLQGHKDWVEDVIFYPDGQILASFNNVSGEADNAIAEIKLWSLDGTEIETFTPPAVQLLTIAFTQDGSQLITADIDSNQAVTIWNLDQNQLLQLGCRWLHDYLQYNKTAQPADQKLCRY